VAGAVPALLVAATLPLPTVIWVAVAFIVIQLIESNILVPRLTGHAVGLHPVGSILALALGFELGGVIGALFAVPLAGLSWVFIFTAARAWADKRIELKRTVDPATLRRRRLAIRQRALLSRTNP
jgi:predicted PurR-regulated permease PerM